MTTPQATCPEWCLDSSNIADLLEWMVERDEWDTDDFKEAIYLLRKPWKWDTEYQQMRAEQKEADAVAKEERLRR